MKRIKSVFALLLLLVFLVDVNTAAAYTQSKAIKKRNTPLWMRLEHYREEFGWQRTNNALEPDPQDVEYLAIAIYCEAGADSISDETRYMVGDVILNRVADERFPDTIYDVLTQKAQYGRFYLTGIVWPDRAENACEAHAVARAREIAYNLLTGTHSELFGEGYIWQAEFKQGKGGVVRDGIFFGR